MIDLNDHKGRRVSFQGAVSDEDPYTAAARRRILEGCGRSIARLALLDLPATERKDKERHCTIVSVEAFVLTEDEMREALLTAYAAGRRDAERLLPPAKESTK